MQRIERSVNTPAPIRNMRTTRRESPGLSPQFNQRAKKRRPFSIGHGLRGGRWPGPRVERDGENCYRGRGWVTARGTIAGDDVKRRGDAVAGFVCLPFIRQPVAAGSPRPNKFLTGFAPVGSATRAEVLEKTRRLGDKETRGFSFQLDSPCLPLSLPPCLCPTPRWHGPEKIL